MKKQTNKQTAKSNKRDTVQSKGIHNILISQRFTMHYTCTYREIFNMRKNH